MSIEGSGRVSFHPPTLAMSDRANTVITDCQASVERVDMAATEVVNSVSNAKSVDSDATTSGPGVALYDLKPNQCLYAVAEPSPRFHLFCAAETQLGKAFCPAHHELCYPTIAARNASLEPQEQRRRKSAIAIKATLE
jgi:hypothetical protein